MVGCSKGSRFLLLGMLIYYCSLNQTLHFLYEKDHRSSKGQCCLKSNTGFVACQSRRFEFNLTAQENSFKRSNFCNSRVSPFWHFNLLVLNGIFRCASMSRKSIAFSRSCEIKSRNLDAKHFSFLRDRE